MARLSPTARRGSEGLGKQPQLMPGPESKQSQADEIRSILALKQSLSDQHDIAVRALLFRRVIPYKCNQERAARP